VSENIPAQREAWAGVTSLDDDLHQKDLPQFELAEPQPGSTWEPD